MTQLVSMTDVSKRLGVSYAAVAKMTRRGELPCVEIGRRRLVRRSDLEEFINERVVCGCGGSRS